MVNKYEWQATEGTVTTYTDSDWAGCVETAKSTSGGIVMIGKHSIKSYSRQQRTVALSSAEAELHAMVAASAETLGVIGLMHDLGMPMQGEVYADSSAAIGIAQRSGKGKLRHLRVQALWVQEVRCTKRLRYKKVLGSRNPADLLTKHVPRELLDAHVTTLGVEYKGGRAESAPTLDNVEPYTEEWEEDLSQGESEESGYKIETGIKAGSKRVRFNKLVQVRAVQAVGKQKSVARVVKATWSTTRIKSADAVDLAEAKWRQRNLASGGGSEKTSSSKSRSKDERRSR